MSYELTTELTPRQLLVRARNLILDPEKWLQGGLMAGMEIEHYYRPEGFAELPDGGRVCSLGALDFAAPASMRSFSVPYTGDVRMDAQRHLCRAIPLDTTILGIPAWNDAPERTHAEVIDAFDRAILLAAAEERGEDRGHEDRGHDVKSDHREHALVTA